MWSEQLPALRSKVNDSSLVATSEIAVLAIRERMKVKVLSMTDF